MRSPRLRWLRALSFPIALWVAACTEGGGPTTESPVLDQLRAGVRVTLLLQENDWYMVRLPDDRLAWGYQSLFRSETNPPESMEPNQVAEKPMNAERS